ncbi:hypothetical protein OX90_06915 [Pseudomonas coronafaciens pv. porri]|uniref:Uncharacterized protein n=1 Tax=Pseudomonas coronafaciens pv. porri TaxID=83964 RepID=A0ABR5JS95_9PSED|nr:hypothetical protein [Pseudomonas coronafaciens]KOP57853.1 hypothetical protein OX88_04090 [Pseudomonas coronafaciens pv. porri]KOP60272.1 hypothetical protein OX90_06915 [Pseudomonas coronafaciens pv. porri]
MQAQHIIILVGLAVCFLLIAVLIKRASDRETLLLTIEFKNLAIRHLEEQLNSGSPGSLTKADLQVLSDTAITLGLAHKTWVHIKGTEPWRTRATTQLEQLNAIVLRILSEIRSSDKPTDSPIDAREAA